MSTPNAAESLVLYGDPIFTGETVDPSKKPPPSTGGSTDKESLARIEDILNAVLPPQ
jgi:hypothetical protein